MKNTLHFLLPLAITCSAWAANVELANPGLDAANGKTEGWTLNNAEAVFTDDGKTAVKLPGLNKEKFAKLLQRLPIAGDGIESIKVVAVVRTPTSPGEGDPAQAQSKPRLRLMYFPETTTWAQSEAIWPEGRKGGRQEIAFKDGWQEVWFELPCPAGVANLEVSVEADKPAYPVEVDSLTLHVTPRS